MVEAVEDSGAVILVVDDNPLIVNVLNSLLQSQAYKVYSSSNGKEALDILKQKTVDLIICDVMMPELDGYSFHDTIRKDPTFSHIPFVFLTALGSSDEISRGTECGADHYVTKPFDPKQLLSVVKGKVVRSKSLKSLSENRYEEYRKRVIHTLSHEFRTPLVAINTGTELLIENKETLDNAKVQSLLVAIQRGGQRLERLVNDFMLLQQIEAGIAQRLYDTRSSPREIGKLVEQFIETKQSSLTEQGYSCSVSNFVGDLCIPVYAPQIEAILDRLLSNAQKFDRENKSLEVCIYPRDDVVAIEVRDRGIGIDVERVKEAVDVFGQIDRERLEQQGGGLGLAISNRYAAIHGGRIEFERREGGGSIVSLVLPKSSRSLK